MDFIWCVNTINHLHDPILWDVTKRLQTLLPSSGGRIALGQSSLLPDMYFAWDSRLEQAVNEADCAALHRRDRYSLAERG